MTSDSIIKQLTNKRAAHNQRTPELPVREFRPNEILQLLRDTVVQDSELWDHLEVDKETKQINPAKILLPLTKLITNYYELALALGIGPELEQSIDTHIKSYMSIFWTDYLIKQHKPVYTRKLTNNNLHILSLDGKIIYSPSRLIVDLDYCNDLIETSEL